MKSLTKSKGSMARQEYNLPLDPGSLLPPFAQNRRTSDSKEALHDPLSGGLTAELDIFGGRLAHLVLLEVEFPTEEDANTFILPPGSGKT